MWTDAKGLIIQLKNNAIDLMEVTFPSLLQKIIRANLFYSVKSNVSLYLKFK